MTDQTVARERNASIRVLLVDDHSVVRRGVRAYLVGYDDIEVAAEAESGQEALDKLATMAGHGELPDVVLIDLLMRGLDGVAATARILERHPTIRVVVLTSFGERERVHAALASGATGFLLKDAKPTEIVEAIRAAARGGVFLDPMVARRLTQEVLSPATGIASLTDRERAALALVAKGRSNQEIADELVISERTVRTHVSNVLRKLGLSSRTQAAVVAVREGLLPADPDRP
ncbi:response regulator transcription factor [Pseudonocardia zijingensis]|uniref:Response regulator transcription factor n=1 Tax=Pseudonocardia zijingensis TaxID=153376 RepID=A0ABP4BDN3_9PSEU